MAETESNPNAFKHFFGKALLKRLGTALTQVYPKFDQKGFLALERELEPLEMKPRVRLIREALRSRLPQAYRQALPILLKTAKAGGLESFDLWPYSDFIQTYGLDELQLSLDALKDLTPLFSSEFAVRPFLKAHPEKALRFLERCARDPVVDVRRWASEGSRPRLPWGERLQDFIRDPSLTLPILETLRYDPELYVRKSVANHLNDIAKDHPEQVVRILSGWKKDAPAEHSPKIDWITRHSLRTLIKAGHPGALKLIGVSGDARIKFGAFKLSQRTYRIGDHIDFVFTIESLAPKPQKLVIDYIIHFMKANQSTSPKVFKLKTLEIPARAELRIEKRHSLKRVTTRKHYPGRHHIEIQINGRVFGKLSWELQA